MLDIMNREFVTYEQALALKKLGFDEPCFRFYSERYTIDSKTGGDIKMGEFYLTDTPRQKTIRCKAPTFSQAFRWFREKQYYSEINVGCTQIDGGIGYEWWVWKPNGVEEWSPEIPGEEWSYKTYEEAEQACLEKLIEIVKDDKS